MTAPLRGVLRFDDGSSVVVSGIAGGDDEATTIAFPPRIVTSVRLEIDRTVADASVGLREFVAHDAGTTPPRWPQTEQGYSTTPPPADACGASSTPVADPVAGQLTLVCPSPGSGVEGEVTVVVAADPGTPLEVLMWTGESEAGPDSVAVVASGSADADGRAVLAVDTSGAPHGPLTLRVQRGGPAPGAPLYVQLVNRAGRQVESPGSAPPGMTLQWAEEFTAPLSVSRTGVDADYAAVKPDASSSGQFGEATFADPASGAGTLATVDDGYLRIRARPAGDAAGQQSSGHLSGLLASTDVSGSGFAAQYGYFEARMMGAPGAGAWSAFWMLNTESAALPSDTAGEVDAVELYGHDTSGSCHTLHSWGASEPTEPDDGAAPNCRDENGFADWAMAWHTYGVRITPDGATFSIDGQEVSAPRGLTHSSEPFFFLVDLALGGGWPVDLSPTGGTTDVYVDWVRVHT
ncbi:glycoside hydrolase family 16 protein [Geodermatophilus sp. SYSU D00804]